MLIMLNVYPKYSFIGFAGFENTFSIERIIQCEKTELQDFLRALSEYCINNMLTCEAYKSLTFFLLYFIHYNHSIYEVDDVRKPIYETHNYGSGNGEIVQLFILPDLSNSIIYIKINIQDNNSEREIVS